MAVSSAFCASMLPHEREFLDRNQFRIEFAKFDWRLNDLTGGRP